MTSMKVTEEHRFPRLTARGESEVGIERTMQSDDSGLVIQVWDNRWRRDS
jgi:hypothetical protein